MADQEFRIQPDTRFQAIGWGILNNVGGMWDPRLFETPEKAFEYIDTFQRDNPRVDLSEHTVVQCRMTVEPIIATAVGRQALRPDRTPTSGTSAIRQRGESE
ncbi:hypothetical protein [Shinella sp.]|uniref:hypothetical protein n=1 Tax=Shinella sp. TaxID=1870904 RepID=UPI0028A0B4BC|nr:hypothetical protein [Shinella sp.]